MAEARTNNINTNNGRATVGRTSISVSRRASRVASSPLTLRVATTTTTAIKRTERDARKTLPETLKFVPVKLPLVKRKDNTTVVHTITRYIPVPPETSVYKSNKSLAPSELSDDYGNEEIVLDSNAESSSEEIDRSYWLGKAMKRNPTLLELWERLRPVSNMPTMSRMSIKKKYSRFTPSMAISSSAGIVATAAGVVATTPASAAGLSSLFFSSPPASPAASGTPVLSAGSPNAFGTPPSNGMSMTLGRKSIGSSLGSAGSSTPVDSKRMSSFDMGMTTSVVSTAVVPATVSSALKDVTATTEVKDVLSRESMLQAIMQHVSSFGYHKAIAVLQDETGILFNGIECENEPSVLAALLYMGSKDEKHIYRMPESIFKETLRDDEEVTASIYTHFVYEDSNEDDAKKNMWDELRDSQQDNLQYMDGKRGLKGGTLNKLIEKLTDSGTPDVKYMKTFLVTYRSFTTPEVLLMKLLERYHVPDQPLVPSMSDEEWLKQKMQIIIRTVNVLIQWIDEFIFDWNQVMLRTLVLFIEDHLMKNKLTLRMGQNILAKVTKKLSGKSLKESAEISFHNAPPQPAVPRNIFTSNIDLFDIDDLELARQLTIIEHEIYRKIKPSELLNQAWNKVKLRHRSPNVLHMIEHFNAVSAWVASAIVRPVSIRQRKMRMTKLINVARYFKELNNFNSLLSIVSGIQNAAVFRLKHTKEECGKKAMDEYESLVHVMKSDRSFKTYRDQLYSIQPPCVPYLGVYLTDLTFVEDGNPDYFDSEKSKRKLINWAKRKLVHNVIQEIQQYQDQPYNLQPVYQVRRLIDMSLKTEVINNENELYDLSLQREPRGSLRQDIA